jgi:hypothetical protein
LPSSENFFAARERLRPPAFERLCALEDDRLRPVGAFRAAGRWPAACRSYPRDSGYVAPSLDVHAHFNRLAPPDEWLVADAVAPVAADGLIGGQARVWSPIGKLLASGGGQMLCRPAPPQRS